MKILHVVPTYVPASRYGGPIRSVHGLARAQAKLGHEVHVSTTSVDGPRDSRVQHNRPVPIDGVQVWYFRSRYLRRLYWSFDMRRFHRQNIGDFDIVHLHSVFLWPTNDAARAATRAGVPYVVSPRGMLDPELIRGHNQLLKTAWIRMFERWTIQHAAAVHFTSAAEERACTDAGVPPRCSIIAPNAIDRDEVEAGEPSEGDPFALCLGRVSWKKGIDRVIAALPHVPELRLVVAGNDEEGLVPGLRELAKRLAVADRVEFVGEVTGSRKWTLLRSARCLVLPSRSENFGNVVLEALAANCPPVITPEVGAAEYLQGAALVTTAEPMPLASAMRRLHVDHTLRHDHLAVGRRLLHEVFSWEGVARRVTNAYRLVGTGQRRSREPHIVDELLT
jgi:glycosyltransferase involved in cell wall biosynthesis